MDNLISPEYRKQNRMLHESCAKNGKPWGTSGKKYAQAVVEFANEANIKSILDYGCGYGTLKRSIQGRLKVKISEYDPAIPGKDAPPQKADLVVCTDVMEHVEPEKIAAVLEHIRALAKEAVYLVIACNDTDHKLPDGRSAHLTVKPAAWWKNVVEQHDWEILDTISTAKKVEIWISTSR